VSIQNITQISPAIGAALVSSAATPVITAVAVAVLVAGVTIIGITAYKNPRALRLRQWQTYTPCGLAKLIHRSFLVTFNRYGCEEIKSNLEALPEEIWQKISTSIQNPKDLMSFRQTCQSFNRLFSEKCIVDTVGVNSGLLYPGEDFVIVGKQIKKDKLSADEFLRLIVGSANFERIPHFDDLTGGPSLLANDYHLFYGNESYSLHPFKFEEENNSILFFKFLRLSSTQHSVIKGDDHMGQPFLSIELMIQHDAAQEDSYEKVNWKILPVSGKKESVKMSFIGIRGRSNPFVTVLARELAQEGCGFYEDSYYQAAYIVTSKPTYGNPFSGKHAKVIRKYLIPLLAGEKLCINRQIETLNPDGNKIGKELNFTVRLWAPFSLKPIGGVEDRLV